MAGRSEIARRVRDIIIATFSLVIIWPLMVVIALGVLSTSGAPVLFRQQRLGRDEKLFTLYKFRSMRVGGEYQNHITPENAEGITPLGLWLRRSRLDELPQLFNILKGDMSLVGPRPMPPDHAAAVPQAFRRKLFSVPPGMTGRSALDFLAEDACLVGVVDTEKAFLQTLLPAKIEREMTYLESQELMKDWRIMAETLGAIWSDTAWTKSRRLIDDMLQTRRP